ncbi:hypothetical protein F511_23649 [Dorcoceras hygrometricum]|uniref:Uncharacterized protein n=1 Tax=Dorcoceras hygrometricum TaxID=472368 RepID=A0A2Z7CRK2_9LAMI|nr:hypothetical protein F511_23649 [Dorcoceras hygrometricum]
MGKVGLRESFIWSSKDLESRFEEFTNLAKKRKRDPKFSGFESLHLSGFVQPFDVVAAFSSIRCEDVCGMLTPTDADLLSTHYISGDFVVSNEYAVTRCMSELMSRGLKVVCSQWHLSPTSRSPPRISSPPISPPLRSPTPISSPLRSPPLRTPIRPPHAGLSNLQSLEERLTGVEVQLTMMRQQQTNIMDVLKSLQSDMLIIKSIVEDKRAQSPVITTGGMTASAETTGRAEETDSPDGFVREVKWTGSSEVAGWTKVAQMVLLSPVREEESGSTESHLKLAPGSDQFHGEIGTLTVEQLRPPNPVHDRNLNSFVGIQLAVGPQRLRLRNHNFGLTHRIMVKHLATSPHDPLGITDSACKNQSVMHAEPLGSLGLNGAGDDPVDELIPTGGDDL